MTDIGKPWCSYWKGPKTVIFGHDAKKNLQYTDHAIGIDTGCCYGRKLTMAIMNSGDDDFILEQVSSEQNV